jgi:mono/diheme cytochrome c family protein
MSDETKSCSAPSNAEPVAARSHLPMWIVGLLLLLLYVGAVYFDHHGGWFNPQVYAPYANAIDLEMYQPQSGPAQTLARGRKLYESNCGTCHSSDGQGKPGQAPPLAGSEWVTAKGVQRLAHIPLAGLNGPIKVEGKDWNMSMAAMGAGMSDADLASVLTYIRNAWSNKAGEVTADDVKAARADVNAHPQALNGEQLMKLPE